MSEGQDHMPTTSHPSAVWRRQAVLQLRSFDTKRLWSWMGFRQIEANLARNKIDRKSGPLINGRDFARAGGGKV
nr:hypothetical protein CFP56_20883 [Quercus suber]